MIDGVSVVWLPVTGIDRALEFYADTLGLDIEQQEDHWALVVAGAVCRRAGIGEGIRPPEPRRDVDAREREPRQDGQRDARRGRARGCSGSRHPR